MATSFLNEEPEQVEALEIDLLLEGVFRRFGHDFRGYRRAPLRSKLHLLMQQQGVSTVSALQDRVMHDDAAAGALLRALGTRPTALFDQPEHFLALRAAVGPWLRSCPAPKIWIADCVSAEQACSVAILLAEEEVYERATVFATFACDSLLDEARRSGISPVRMQEYEENYRRGGGKAALSDYIVANGGQMAFRPELMRNITWAQYNLTPDASFNEFELILCRRTLSDFDALLRRRTLQLFHDSLSRFGIVSVDGAEEMEAAPFETRYKPLCAEQGLYRRMM